MSGDRGTTGERDLDGYRALSLLDASAALEATFVPEAGMVCASLRHRGEELLGQRHGLRAYAAEGKTMGVPLLYPWANRLSATTGTAAGREIAVEGESGRVHEDENGLPIHGLLAGDPGWSVRRHEATAGGAALAAEYEFSAPELLAMFPFPHRLVLEAELAGAALAIRVTVEASAGSPVPIAFGFHPYLTLPGVERAAWELEAPVAERIVLDGRGIPTGERRPDRIESGPLGERTYDDAFLAPPAGGRFALAGGGRRIEVELLDGYPFTQVFAPPSDAVICFEPMTAPTDALLTGGPDLRVLDPGDAYRAAFAISVR